MFPLLLLLLSRYYDAVTHASTSLTMNSQHMRRLERFTVLKYSKNCESESVNEARKMMFTHRLKSLENIPPTRHALFQHAKRSLLTAAFIWKLSLHKNPEIPKPSEWGLEWNYRTRAWVPYYWTDLPDARCKPWVGMLDTTPLWLLGRMQGQLQMVPSRNSM